MLFDFGNLAFRDSARVDMDLAVAVWMSLSTIWFDRRGSVARTRTAEGPEVSERVLEFEA